MSPLRILGALVAVVGLVLVFAPTLVHDPGPTADTFEAIERRIPWGGLLGIGALLIARRELRPWVVTFASFVLWMTTGLLLARLVGLSLDGADSAKQWMWVGVEAAVAAVAALYLWRRRRRESA